MANPAFVSALTDYMNALADGDREGALAAGNQAEQILENARGKNDAPERGRT